VTISNNAEGVADNNAEGVR